MKTYLIDYFDMFDSLLIITLFLLASLLVRLLTLRLSINTKHLCLFFHSLQILTDFLKFRPPSPIYFDPPFIKFRRNLRTPSPPFTTTPLFIRHLRLYIYMKKKAPKQKKSLVCITKCFLWKRQYVGKSEIPFHIRLNNPFWYKNQNAIEACKHFNNWNHAFHKLGKFIRLKDRQNYWIKRLKTLICFGLNQELN